MIEKNGQGSEEALNTLKKIIEAADVAMLSTIGEENKIVSRPMKLQEVEYDGDIWFLTTTETDAYVDVQRNNKVNVVIADKSYASISGTAEIVQDSVKIKEFWSKAYEMMFDLQQDDPKLVLIKVSSDTAEYWATGSLAKSAYNFMKKVVGKEEPVPPGKNTNETLEL